MQINSIRTNSEENEIIYCPQCSTPMSAGQKFCCRSCELLHEMSEGHLPIQADSPKVISLKKEFEYLDLPNFEEKYKWSDEHRIFKFYVEGLQCSSCVHLIEDLPQFYSEVLNSRVNFAEATLRVELSEKAEIAKVLAIVKELGYRPVPLKKNQSTSEQFQNENRTFLKRIAVAGFCAGNTMLFVIPVYAGLAGTLGNIFNWISFVLFLPILFYSAVPFYRGAWNYLKYKKINVDLPIVIAMLAGFILSTFNLVNGSKHIYYDSTASFIFLILVSRYLLKRIQQHYLGTSDYASFFPDAVFIRKDSNIETPISLEDIKSNDVILVKNGQTLPVDGSLESSTANINLSLLNGESLPQKIMAGMKVFAGTQNVGNDIWIKTSFTQKETRLGQILSKLETESMSKAHYISLTDKWAQILIVAVFGLAGLFFALYSLVDVQEALNRSLALIVVACPCALSFGTPLAYGLALQKARKLGIIMKTGEAFEKLRQIKTICFDKTGTLTSGSLELTQTFPQTLSSEQKNIILNLESVSLHPIAAAIRKSWGADFSPLTFSKANEVIGQGVEAEYNGHFYELKSSAIQEDKDLIQTTFFIDKKPVAYLYFTDCVRPDANQVIQQLKNKQMDIFILSGDHESSVTSVAQKCGIEKNYCLSSMTPESKLDFIQKKELVCMIGDGANDALALQKSHLGIAVQGSVDLSLQHSDVYFTRGGLNSLLELIYLSEKTQKTVHRSIALSLTYNTIGGTLSLMGLIDPMMAAILMPISSAIIVLSTLWGLR